MPANHEQRRAEHGFDRLIILESLAEGEDNTGSKLKAGVLDYLEKSGKTQVQVELLKLESKDELLSRLQVIAHETITSGEYPALHFEIHGNDPETGLAMRNGDEISWSELREGLTAINHACRNNLVLVLAVCSGAGLQTIMPASRAPFWGVIAPTGIIHSGPLYEGMKAFYLKLLQTGDGDAALRELNGEGAEEDANVRYTWRTAEGLFRDYFAAQLHTDGSAALSDTEIDSKARALMRSKEGYELAFAAARRLISAAASSQGVLQRVFEKTRTHYLMLDDFPQEAERFLLTLEDSQKLRNT